MFTGEYQLGRDRVFTIACVDGGFLLTTPDGIESRLELESGATYKVPGIGKGTTLTFLAGEAGRVTGFSVSYEGTAPRRLRKIK
jgi:hypothetical protein